MIRIRKYHVLLLTFFVSSVSTAILFILLGISHKSPSIYHVFIPSFNRNLNKPKNYIVTDLEKKSNRGNLYGITSKLHSPMRDDGYDVHDYYKVNPLFGTDQSFIGKEGLLRKANKLGLKVIVDLVMNHTSYTHEWFEAAINNLGKKHEEFFSSFYYIFKQVDRNYQASETPPKVELLYGLDGHNRGDKINLPWWNDRGFYELKTHPYTCLSLNTQGEIAAKGKSGKSWECEDDNLSHYYYLYTFSWFQPDLNWNNQIVQQEMAKIANFWIKKGEKGFRFDAIPLIGKDIDKPLTVPNPKKLESFLKEFKEKSYGKEEEKGFVTISELSQSGTASKSQSQKLVDIASDSFSTAYLPIDNLYYYPKLGNGKMAVFPRGLKNIRNYFTEWVNKEYFYQKIDKDINPALLMENHDHMRSVSRYGGCMDDDDYIDDTGDVSKYHLAWDCWKDPMHSKIPPLSTAWKYWHAYHYVDGTLFANEKLPETTNVVSLWYKGLFTYKCHSERR